RLIRNSIRMSRECHMTALTYGWPFPRIQLAWIGGPNTWPTLFGWNLTHPPICAKGVYIVWSAGPNPVVVRVGQGVIANRLQAHRSDPRIRRHDVLAGPLYASWAAVDPSALDGVEHYLGLMLRPKVGRVFPLADPIAVNLPW